MNESKLEKAIIWWWSNWIDSTEPPKRRQIDDLIKAIHAALPPDQSAEVERLQKDRDYWVDIATVAESKLDEYKADAERLRGLMVEAVAALILCRPIIEAVRLKQPIPPTQEAFWEILKVIERANLKVDQENKLLGVIKLKKLLEITCCNSCWYLDEVDGCHCAALDKRIEWNTEIPIPDWCPLPDAPGNSKLKADQTIDTKGEIKRG